MLPDKSILKGQKLVENAKIEKLKCDILSDFQDNDFSQINEKVSFKIASEASYVYFLSDKHKS